MRYNEETARALIERYGLSPVTIRVWRKRGQIPDQYAGEIPPDTSERVKPGLQKRISDALLDDRINTKQITSVPMQKIRDVSRGGSSFTENEAKELRREFTSLRNLLRLFTQGGSEATLKKIIAHPLIHQWVLFREQKKMLDRLRAGLSAYERELEDAKIEASKLYSDLKF